MLTAQELFDRAKAANNAWRFAAGRRLLLRALERAEDDALRSAIEGSLGFVEAELGDPHAGFEVLSRALSRRSRLEPAEVGRLLAQRGLIWMRLGRPRDSIADFTAGIPLITAPDELGRARMNRGVLQLHLGHVKAAIEDFDAAVAEFGRAELALQQAKARHNLGYSAMLAGDLVGALTLMDAAAKVVNPQSVESAAVSNQDRAEALFAAGMVDDARELLGCAAQQFGQRRWYRAQAEADYVLARTALLNDPRTAITWARKAARLFRRVGAPAWTLRCEALILGGELELGRPRHRAARELAGRLRASGMRGEALVLRLLAALPHRSGPALEPMPRVGPDDPLPTRLLAHEVAAARAERAGRLGTALARLRAGVDELQAWQSRFGSLDLQTAAAAHGRRIAEQGVRIAVHTRRPAKVYEWAELTGALAGRVVPLRPPSDPQTASDLIELRLLAQRSPEPGTADALRQTELLQQVRQRAWQDDGSARLSRLVSLADVQAELAATDACLFAPVSGDEQAWGLVVTGSDARVVRLGTVSAIRAELGGLPADLDLAAADLSPGIAAAVRASLAERMQRLDDLILAPVAGLLRERRVVINPTGIFSGLCWTLMPTLAGRPLTIPRSASTWVAARALTRERTRAGFAAGPRLARAEPEILAAAAHWPHSEVLTGARAGAADVAGLATRVDVLHLAAHGHHVNDNPLFAHLELADGPWYGYDLDQLAGVPDLVVLSACELGATAIRRGDELLGLTTAWLHAGARCVIAAPASVSDAVAEAVLPEFHRQVVQGAAPADALAALSAAHPELMSIFQCYGAGW